MAVNEAFLYFWSEANYMKRDISSGTATLTLGAFGSTVSQTVNHNLGYIPFYQVFTEQDNTGKIWAASKIDQYTETSLTGNNPVDPTLTSWVTTTQLVLNLINNTSPTASGPRQVYWLIYKDYGNV